MNTVLRITLIVALIVYFSSIGYLLKRKTLALKYTLLWLVSGLIMFLFVLFPGALQRFFRLLGVVELTNGLFALVLFFLLITMITLTAIVSKLNEQIRQLVQRCAMYEKRIRELEDNQS